MNKYFLPLNIENRRIYIQHLEYNSVNAIKNNFIICPKEDNYCLFSLVEDTKLLASFGTDYDLALKDLNFFLEYDNDLDELSIQVSLREKVVNKNLFKNSKNSDERFSIGQGAKILGFDIVGESDAINFIVDAKKIGKRRIDCIISYNIEEKNYKGRFSLQTSINEELIEAVLDFGSEASQLAYTINRNNLDFINFVNELNNKFYYPHTEKENGFPIIEDDSLNSTYQYDVSNKHFLRSNFFVQKKDGKIGGKNVDNLFYHEKPLNYAAESWIKIFAKRSLDFYGGTSSSHILLPNFKLERLLPSNETKIQNVNFKIVDKDNAVNVQEEFAELKESIYRCLLNQIIHTILAKFNKPPFNCLKLALLVPNIYEQKDVYDLIRNLQEDITNACHACNYSVKSVEIRTISESDASFLGLINGGGELRDLVEIQKKSSYLIIDGGKGTMDLSIVHYDEDEQWLCKYRSGFPGSGNAITFAFADTIFAMIAGNERKSYFKKLISQADWNIVYEFYENLEKLKINYSNPNSRKSVADIKQLSTQNKIIGNTSLKLEALNNFLEDFLLENDWSINDDFGLIDATLNDIVKTLEEQFIKSGGVQCKQVLLAGRAFLFEPLKKKLNDWVTDNKIAEKEVVFVKEKAKFLCVLGPLNSEQGVDRGSSLVGIPIFRDKKRADNWSNLFDRYAPGFIKILKDRSQKLAYREKIPTQRELFFEGFSHDFQENENLFSISGRDYRVDNLDWFEDKEFNMFFAGNGFVFRNRTKNVTFRAVLDQKTIAYPLLKKSLFPYSSDNIEFQIIDDTILHTSNNNTSTQNAIVTPAPKMEPQENLKNTTDIAAQLPTFEIIHEKPKEESAKQEAPIFEVVEEDQKPIEETLQELPPLKEIDEKSDTKNDESNDDDDQDSEWEKLLKMIK